MAKEADKKFNVKEAITAEIIASLEEAGTVWHKDWKCMGVPMSMSDKKGYAYKGINFLILSLKQICKGYTSSKWITYKNMQKLGGELKPIVDEQGNPMLDGEGKKLTQKTTMITFYTPIECKDKQTGELKKIPFLKYYRVFNIEQTTLADEKKYKEELKDLDPVLMNDGIEDIINTYDCKLEHLVQDKACYIPTLDKIAMPVKEQFTNYHAYYSTLLHEMAHSTGHTKRLDRFNETKKLIQDSKENYAFEELVAELTSMFLLATHKIDNEAVKDMNKAYIKSWLKGLKDNPDYIFKASRYAQKAFELIQGIEPYKAEEAQEEKELATV